MKRLDLIRQIEKQGCLFLRHGGRHDWYQNPQTGVWQPIPPHGEIKEPLARGILRKLKTT
jgi:predicted RNA binding protein YcfA (HicA-like mRNA interferase family)